MYSSLGVSLSEKAFNLEDVHCYCHLNDNHWQPSPVFATNPVRCASYYYFDITSVGGAIIACSV